MNRGGQMKISFGMIFSIILIVMFLSLGFYAISGFLEMQDTIMIEKFVDDFQESVDKMCKNEAYGTRDLSFKLPTSVDKICITDRVKNLEIWIDSRPNSKIIEKINIEKTLKSKKNICIDVIDGKTEFSIEQEFGDNSVIVRKLSVER